MISSHTRWAAWTFLLCVLDPGGLLAQPALETLDARLAVEFDTPFTRISGMAALPDGRLVVTDSEERRIVVLDPATGRTTGVSRHGQGPREFLRPFAPMALPDGSVWIYDVGNRRFLELDADGNAIGVHDWPTDADYAGRSPPIAVDDAGHLYWEAWSSAGGKAPINAWILRWTPGSGDDLRRDGRILVRDPQGRLILRQFLDRDGWSVTPSGAIGVVRADERRVEWLYPDGTTRVGPELDLERYPIDEAEIAALERATSAGASAMKGGDDTQRPARRTATEWFTPESLPPFYYERVYAVAPTGLWAQRRLPVDSPTSLIWTFDEEGRPVRRIRVDDRISLLRVEEAGTFWGVHTDDLGLQHLRRYVVDPEG